MVNAKNYSSHIPVLLEAIRMTEGAVLEMGIGYFSTSILHWLCAPLGRMVVSLENNKQMYDLLPSFKDPLHEVNLINSWEKADIEWPWGWAVIEHEPGKRRKIDAARLAQHARLILLHDTSPEQDRVFQYGEVWPLFKYVLHYHDLFPGTSLLSNFIKLDEQK